MSWSQWPSPLKPPLSVSMQHTAVADFDFGRNMIIKHLTKLLISNRIKLAAVYKQLVSKNIYM